MQTLLGTGDVETVGPKGWQEHVSQERLLGEVSWRMARVRSDSQSVSHKGDSVYTQLEPAKDPSKTGLAIFKQYSVSSRENTLPWAILDSDRLRGYSSYPCEK